MRDDKMNLLNKEYFELMKKFRDNNNLQDQLTDNDCKSYANMFSVFADITENKLTFDKMLETYNYVTDVIDGKYPKIMIIIDKYRDIYRLLSRYSITKNLDEEIRKKLAYLIYQAKCIMIMDEETMNPTWNMELFETGTENFLKEYEFELKNYPSQYEIKKSLSDPTKDDFGLSINNPIEVVSVAAEYDYLGLLLTKEGKKITYERIGSQMNDDTPIDVYKIYTKTWIGKKEIATIYISGYGNENTRKVPKGFRMMTLEELEMMNK